MAATAINLLKEERDSGEEPLLSCTMLDRAKVSLRGAPEAHKVFTLMHRVHKGKKKP